MWIAVAALLDFTGRHAAHYTQIVALFWVPHAIALIILFLRIVALSKRLDEMVACLYLACVSACAVPDEFKLNPDDMDDRRYWMAGILLIVLVVAVYKIRKHRKAKQCDAS